MDEAKLVGICQWCAGTGINTETKDANGNPISIPCSRCNATGKILSSSAIDITDLLDKIDAIKSMLDSTVYGMQKMSSNLDDIMVKLDV